AAAWACSAAGALLFTTNAGNTWDSVRSPNSAPMAKVFFLNRNIGWVMADQYYIYRTLDGGATWYRNQITADPNVTLNGLWFSDILHGWVTGSNGFVALTSNSDSTWQQVAAGSFIPQIPNGVSVNAIGFIDAQNGWITGTGGTIYFSNDSGNTWHAQASGTVNDLFGLDMVDIGNGWTAGNNGAILKFSNAGSSLAFAGKVIDFGRVAFGLTKTIGIPLKNSDGTSIPINNSTVYIAAPIDQSNIPGQFVLENPPSSVPPVGNDSLYFTFRPIATGGGVGQPRLRAGVSDIYGQGGVTAPLTLIGSGAYSSLQLISPSKKLDFQSVYVGHCSKPFIIVVKNTGEIPITLSEVVNDTLFHLLDPGQTIQPGEVDTLHLIYCPIKPGIDNGSIIINGAPKPDTVLLVGQGIKVAISFLKNRLDTIFCSYGFIDMTVANVGNTTWYIQNPIIRNPDGYLQLVNVSPANGGCGQGQPLNKGDTCFFKFQITDPKAPAGTCDSTWLVFTDEVGDLLDSVFFNWCDESSNINDYDVKPLFTCIPVGTCETRIVVLTNGGADLVLDSIAIQGLNADAFSWTPLSPSPLIFPYALAKGDSIKITWHFCPTVNDTGDQSNARIVTYYAPCGQGSPVIGDTNSDAFGACGILQGFSVSPSCIEFGDTLRLGKDTPKTLANTLHFINAGATPITIYITDLHPSTDFSFNPVDSLVVPANGAIDTFSATFNPDTPGCKDDTLLFYSLQPAQSAKVCMHGCAFTQGLFWSPTNIPFGSVLIGDTTCVTGYIKNTGSDTITISSESGSSPAFTVTLLGGTLPYSIPPGDSVFVRFCYVPKQLGGDSLS
ncbi:MAG TPA: YCF48-related protein, partial [Candidatus Kapabacteria bacterium]|nr:YCF48-related protein [Candidatus Kapabacteria bacterium]